MPDRPLRSCSASRRTPPTTRSRRRTAQLARELHPDANPDDPRRPRRGSRRSPPRTRRCAIPERRRRYDMFGDDGRGRRGPGGPGEAFGLGDLFDAFFGGEASAAAARRVRRAAPDAETVDRARPRRGRVRRHARRSSCAAVECERCDGSGCEPGTHPSGATTCDGAGEVRQVRRSILGQLVTAAPCPACGGTGQRDPEPVRDVPRRRAGARHARTSTSRSRPASTTASGSGSRAAVPAAPRGGVPGDLYVTRARAARTRRSSATATTSCTARRSR